MEFKTWQKVSIATTIILTILTAILIWVTLDSTNATKRVVDLAERQDFREKINLGINLKNEIDFNYQDLQNKLNLLEKIKETDEIPNDRLNNFAYLQSKERFDFGTIDLRIKLEEHYIGIETLKKLYNEIANDQAGSNREYKAQHVDMALDIINQLIKGDDPISVPSLNKDLTDYLDTLILKYNTKYNQNNTSSELFG